MGIKYSVAVLVLCILTTACPAFAGQAYKNSASGFSFETPVEFSKPAKLGLDALSCVYPARSKPGAELFSITLVSFSKGALEAQPTTEGDLVAYVKSTFLAAGTRVGTSIHRTFLGKKIMGERVETSIPAASIIEVFPLTCANGSKVVISFKWNKEMTEKDAGAVISTVARTLKGGKP